MRRTQLYLEENLYALLKKISKSEQLSVSELVRQSLIRSYKPASPKSKIQAMQKAFGVWKDRDLNAETYIRALRKNKHRFYNPAD